MTTYWKGSDNPTDQPVASYNVLKLPNVSPGWRTSRSSPWRSPRTCCSCSGTPERCRPSEDRLKKNSSSERNSKKFGAMKTGGVEENVGGDFFSKIDIVRMN